MNLERECRECGCTDTNACVDEHSHACFWVEYDLCSSCLDVEADLMDKFPDDALAQGISVGDY